MMIALALADKARMYIRRLCRDIPTRRVGSHGNRLATDFFAETVAAFGFQTTCAPFDCMDWRSDGAQLSVNGIAIPVSVSPYSLGLSVRGPPGYDNGDFFRQWLFGYDQTEGYKVLRAGQVIGGVIVWILPDGHNVLGTIFVDPDAQDQGVGTRVWQFMEARYPETKSWRLITPRWATKNHHFYAAKCGFERVESDPIVGSPEGEFVYRKEMAKLTEGVDPRLAAQGED